jgi:hypothetical protein
VLIENPLNESSLTFPLLESIHILGFICAVGTIALVNFRLLGMGLTQKSAAELWRATMPWTLGGLVLVIFSGLLLFGVNPEEYYLNRIFLMKMSLLVLAIVFYYTLVRQAAAASARAGIGRTVSCISLALWTAVICGGIFLGQAANRPPAAAAQPPSSIHFDDFLQAAPHSTTGTPPRPPSNQ